MLKLQRISQFQHRFDFKSPEENFNLLYNRFLESDLGKIYSSIPWDELVLAFDLKESRKGPDCLFSPKGKLALMFLKNYAGCSDKRLIEQLNANTHYQLFCNFLLPIEDSITNFKIVSQIRTELSAKLDVKKAQKVLASNWLSFMTELNHATTDATCYESEVRYPTNIKLLWESVDWSYHQMKLMCKYQKTQLPRTKYLKWKPRYFEYSRKRRRSKKDTRILTRALLNLLNKLNDCLDQVESVGCIELPDKYYRRRKIIRKVYNHLSSALRHPN